MKITEDEMRRFMFDGDTGFCTSCGAEQLGVEPDAEGYTCECCGESAVSGAEQLLLLGQLTIVPDPPEHIETHPDAAYGMDGGW